MSYFTGLVMAYQKFITCKTPSDGATGKELFILFAASAFRKLSSIYVFSYFPFGFEGRIWDLIVSVPDHCLSFYFLLAPQSLMFSHDLVQFISKSLHH